MIFLETLQFANKFTLNEFYQHLKKEYNENDKILLTTNLKNFVSNSKDIQKDIKQFLKHSQKEDTKDLTEFILSLYQYVTKENVIEFNLGISQFLIDNLTVVNLTIYDVIKIVTKEKMTYVSPEYLLRVISTVKNPKRQFETLVSSIQTNSEVSQKDSIKFRPLYLAFELVLTKQELKTERYLDILTRFNTYLKGMKEPIYVYFVFLDYDIEVSDVDKLDKFSGFKHLTPIYSFNTNNHSFTTQNINEVREEIEEG